MAEWEARKRRASAMEIVAGPLVSDTYGLGSYTSKSDSKLK